jgi:hypothetical protein
MHCLQPLRGFLDAAGGDEAVDGAEFGLDATDLGVGPLRDVAVAGPFQPLQLRRAVARTASRRAATSASPNATKPRARRSASMSCAWKLPMER